MFATLPLHIQLQLKQLLQANEFPAAKKLYDQSLKSSSQPINQLPFSSIV